MADLLYETYQHYGTHAQRLAFTPSPPAVSGCQPIYIWYETDTGLVYLYDSSWHLISTGSGSAVYGLVIDGGGSVITTGVKGYIMIPKASTITKWTLLSIDGAGPATAGSIQIDIWKIAYGSYPPTVANTITASAKPTLSSANKNQSSTLTGWTTAIAANDTLGFNVDSATAVTKVILELEVSIP